MKLSRNSISPWSWVVMPLVGRVLDVVVGEHDVGGAGDGDGVARLLRRDLERHRLGHTVQGQVAGRGRRDLARRRPEWCRARSAAVITNVAVGNSSVSMQLDR